VLSYFDAACYRQQVRTVLSPDHDWRNCAHVVDYAFGVDIPQLYGGYISPLSRLNEPDGMHFFVSQWITATNDPYRVMLVKDTLFATAGPLGDIQPRVRGRSVPDQDSDQAPAELDRSDVVPSPPDYGDRSGQPRRTSYSGAVTGSVAKMPVSPPSPPR
jgi:hypothetical protein